MEPVTAAELASVLTAATGNPELRRVLAEAVRKAMGPMSERLLQEWAEADAGPGTTDRFRALAEALAGQAAISPQLTQDLRWWIMSVTMSVNVDNAVTEGTTVSGSVVQAGQILGGVHFHASPVPEAAVRPAVVPHQLLPVSRHFMGRATELAALDELMGRSGNSPVLAVISGPAGVGKTALASRWLGSRAGEFPDGQLYADLRGHSADGEPVGPGEILGQFLRALGAAQIPAGLGEQAALWRSYTAGLRLAVMLENPVSAAQIRPLLTGAPGSLVAVTSRLRLTGLAVDGATFLQLGVMSADSALELLSRRVGADRVLREPEAARQVAELCAGLPLAVCVAAARMAVRPRQPLASMAGALGRGGASRLETLRMDGQHAVEAALDESYRLLPPDLARAYRCLGLSPVPVFNGPVAAAACAVPPEEAGRLLDELAEVNLLEDLGPDSGTGLDRYRFHDLTRAHAGRLAAREERPPDRQDTVRRVIDFYLATATAAEALLSPGHRTLSRDYAFAPEQPPPFTESQGALAWLDTETPHLMAALRTSADQGWDTTAWQLADALWPLFLRLRPYALWIEAYETGLAAAERLGDRQAVSRMLTSGGSGLLNAGRHDDAARWFAQARDGARRDGDAGTEAQALHGLGQTHRLAERLTEAAGFFDQALELRETIGHRRGAALTRLCLGDIALAADRPEQALTFLVRARADLLAEDDAYDAARALAFLGRARAGSGDHELAERQLIQARDEFAAAGSVHWQARVLEMLGESAEERRDTARARDWYEQSLARYTPVSTADAARLETRLRRLGRRSGP
ncbi:ATP-binding protein [Streptomyces sp. NPDC059479]|uniref:ATP-binding protein n=1 Tax=Streptomyces sp. NPDC059479 TaxID=3346848 RepID=UPI0036B5A80A